MINVVSRTIQFGETQPTAFPLDLIAQKDAVLGRICNNCNPTALNISICNAMSRLKNLIQLSHVPFYDFKAHA